jgi:hypothetical protein
VGREHDRLFSRQKMLTFSGGFFTFTFAVPCDVIKMSCSSSSTMPTR